MDELIFPANNSPQQDYRQLYAEVLAQLRKDFHPYAQLQEHQTEELSAEFLKNLIYRWLQIMVSENPHALGQILYRIDLPEKKAKSLVQSADEESNLQQLAFAILRREAQKIWLRHQLS